MEAAVGEPVAGAGAGGSGGGDETGEGAGADAGVLGAGAAAARAALGFLATAAKLDMSGMGLLDALCGDGVDAVRPGVDLLREGRLGGPGPVVQMDTAAAPGSGVA